jgi:hypothetical protein
MKKTVIILAVLSLFGLQISAQPNIGQFFNNLKNKVIANADKLGNWKNEAENALRKTAKDFTDCPSPAAQNLYDDLKAKLEQAKETERLANEADREAQTARDNCKRITRMNAQCDASYNGLTFKATADAARAAADSLQKAINALKALKCANGCQKNAQIIYPTFTFGERTMNVVDIARVPAPPFGNLLVPYMNEITYCTNWRRGSFWANWNSGNGEFDANFHLRLPKCEKNETVRGCSEWDLTLLLPQLQKLKIIPANITAPDLKVKIPNREVNVISDVKKVNCTKPIKVPKRASVTLNVELSSNPLEVLSGQGQEMVEIGCAEPAFGLEPETSKATVPDLTKARISWKGITVKAGYIEIDLSKPEFRAACKKGFPSSLKVPTVTVGNGYLDLPYACLQPRMVDLIARK